MADELLLMLAKQERLQAITQRIGFAVWQLQELEDVLAQALILMTKATPGMDKLTLEELVDKARNKPLGNSIRGVKDANLFSQELRDKLDALLAERNWLIHRSRRDSRTAYLDDRHAIALIDRTDSIAETSLALLREVGTAVEKFVLGLGVSKSFLDKKTAEIDRTWHAIKEESE